MLEKLAKQTAVYGISTIAVRFLSYLLTPVFTRVFEPEAYGIVTDVYALIPFALGVLTMGLESAYFRFAATDDGAAAAAGGTEGEIAARARAGPARARGCVAPQQSTTASWWASTAAASTVRPTSIPVRNATPSACMMRMRR